VFQARACGPVEGVGAAGERGAAPLPLPLFEVSNLWREEEDKKQDLLKTGIYQSWIRHGRLFLRHSSVLCSYLSKKEEEY